MGIRRKRRRTSRFRNRPEGTHHRELLVEPGAEATSVRALAYGPAGYEELDSPTADQIKSLAARNSAVWVDVAGLAGITQIQDLGRTFGMHPLALEDVVRPHQRPKVEDYPESLFIVARMAPCADQDDTEQLSLFLTGNCLITFQEYLGDDLDGVRNRIRTGRGRIRTEKVDYLTYAIIDAVIDAYFPLVDRYGEMVETLEDQLVLSPSRSLLQEIYQIRRKLLNLRRALWPHREMLATLYRGETSLITPGTAVFLRDCYDHTIQLIDLMENYRELASNLMEVYLSSVSNRLNEIMKVLTIISAIFIPLTFIVGVYGMNFHTDSSPWNMPELRAYYGYPVCIAAMLLLAILEIVYFIKKGWLKSDKASPLELPDESFHPEKSREPGGKSSS